MCGQTHSIATHRTYYDKSEHKQRKRKYEEGNEIQETFHKIFEESTVPSHTESTVPSHTERSPTREIESPPPPPPPPAEQQQAIPSFHEQHQIYSQISLRIPNHTMELIMDEADFGTARNDLNKTDKKRFDWLQEEIEYLQHYICNEEPLLSDSERKNRHSSCLKFLRKAPRDIKQWFHPHHVETSARLKTGYDYATNRLNGK